MPASAATARAGGGSQLSRRLVFRFTMSKEPWEQKQNISYK